MMVPASEALEQLKEGNRRYVEGAPTGGERVDAARRAAVAEHQEPMAIVVGCSDSRVPVEIVFDQGLGDLFVIRVAGNIVAPSQLESVEFAAVHFGSRLVVVLGHSRCGAVKASLVDLHRPAELTARSLRRVADNIRPTIDDLLVAQPECDSARVVSAGVRANIEASVRALQQEPPTLAKLAADHGLTIVGAEYSLDSGVVHWL